MLFVLQFCGLVIIALLIGVAFEKCVTAIATWLNNKKYTKLSQKGKNYERSNSTKHSNQIS